MRRYDIVLFDADNTLFDFDHAEAEALRRVTEERGYELTLERRAVYHEINDRLWRRFDRGEISRDWLVIERFRAYLQKLGSSADPGEMNRAYLQALGQCSVLLPGAEALCRRLKPFCRMAVLTNGITESQTGRLERSAIHDCMEALFISQAMGCQKPQREFFDQVYAAMALTPAELERTVMVGDNLQSDILGGINGGIDTIWYRRTGAEPDPAIRPTWEAATLEEVGDLILNEDEPSKKDDAGRNFSSCPAV